MDIDADNRPLPIRPALAAAIEEAWMRLAGPGTWWSAAERLALTAEVRQARGCRLCAARKRALSPYTVTGTHDGTGHVPEHAVEAIHRIATDAGRITKSWVRAMTDGPLGDAPYVEIVSLVAVVTALDTFDHALGRPLRSLPLPADGAPSRLRPAGARCDLAWVATLAPEAVAAGEPNPYPVHGDKNIHRALSLVPQEVFNFFDLDVELYLKDHEIRDFATEHRAISHAQIELIAGRASAINACFY